MKPCKFAQKVWNAQQAGAIGVRFRPPVTIRPSRCLHAQPTFAVACRGDTQTRQCAK